MNTKNIFHLKLVLISVVLLCANVARSQSIFTALHLNDKQENKTVRPKKIVETNVFYTRDGKNVKKATKTFDNAGMLVIEERTDDDGTLTARLTYTNDTLNRLVLSRTFESWNKTLGASKETAEYVYDNNHSLVGVLDKNAQGNIYDKFEMVNNENGDPVSLRGSNFNGKLFGREAATYFYDKNKVAVSVIRNDGEVLSTDTMVIKYKKDILSREPGMEFNNKGDMTAWVSKNFAGTQTTMFQSEYTYDDKGNCTNEVIYKVTIKTNGKRKLEKDREFKKIYFY